MRTPLRHHSDHPASSNTASSTEFQLQSIHTPSISSHPTTANIPSEVLANTKVLLTWKVFPKKEQVPKLQYVQLLSAGCNQIQGLPFFKESDVAFCTANGAHPTYMTHLENQRISKWVEIESNNDIEDAVGLRIGILGYGCIGRQIARVATAFGMSVYAYTLRPRPTPASRHDESFAEPGLGDPEGVLPGKWFAGPEQLEEFLSADLDVLVITLLSTKAATSMLALPQFQLLAKRKPYICNVGRGTVINTSDLMTALDNGWIRGAALDVTDPEPLPEGHRFDHYSERVVRILTLNVGRLREGKDIVNRVSRELGY
ncbi:NAD(P)-binding protein [Zopfia rhizophila CBS 207.26]|uniref:NAD(P)-binding protein n=1 Tax=Zopfia rhizophila CBS 207.26 TaxID=1314779 RepID=A0A6A6DRN0_9PEZI|nr:NAD(P)-binding protein [Zopfia rhizophila CBS 207.26]